MTPPSVALIRKAIKTIPRLCQRWRPLPGPCSKYGSHRSSVMKIVMLPIAITGVRLFNDWRRSSMFQL